MAEPLNLASVRFGKLTAIDRAVNVTRSSWNCRCDCGRIVIVTTTNLRRGNSTACRSCGHVTHGWTDTPEYRCYADMLQRCDNAKNKRYADYGGRGITVCDDWRASFENFVRDVGPRPSAEHSIDRIDNDAHYEPGNVRWTTAETQQTNRRCTRLVTIEGKTQTIAAWARELGLSYSGMAHRAHAIQG